MKIGDILENGCFRKVLDIKNGSVLLSIPYFEINEKLVNETNSYRWYSEVEIKDDWKITKAIREAK